MRCAKCGRFLPGHGPQWALACACSTEDPVHPCPACPKGDSVERVFGDCHDGCALIAAWLVAIPMAAMIAAIRKDLVVGRGTCSRIDECLDDKDLVKDLAGHGISTVTAALKWAREDEGLFREEGLNQRWGEDDDPQLKEYRDFTAADFENPIE